jgi:hypothetical protein
VVWGGRRETGVLTGLFYTAPVSLGKGQPRRTRRARRNNSEDELFDSFLKLRHVEVEQQSRFDAREFHVRQQWRRLRCQVPEEIKVSGTELEEWGALVLVSSATTAF